MYEFPPSVPLYERLLFGAGFPLLASILALGATTFSIAAFRFRQTAFRWREVGLLVVCVALSFALNWPALARYAECPAMCYVPMHYVWIPWIAGLYLAIAFRTKSWALHLAFMEKPAVQYWILVIVVAWLFAQLLLSDVNSGPAPFREKSQFQLAKFGSGIYRLMDDTKSPFESVTRRNGADVSWRVSMLSYLGEEEIHRRYDTTRPWNDPVNTAVARYRVDVFLSPALEITSDENGLAYTSYGLVCGPGTAFASGSLPKKMSSSTIIGGECEGLKLRWAEPKDADTAQQEIGINRPASSRGASNSIFSSYEGAGGVNVLHADGHVTFLSKDIKPTVLRMMINPAESATIPDP